MTSLESVLEKLGLAEYLPALVDEGFTKWETVLDITEADLSALGFKRGHRRILQREIASFRGISPSRRASPQIGLYSEESVESQDGSRQDSKSTGKRKYRHHPKNDDNAPEKPPSAYVMFANDVRAVLKNSPELTPSFTEIARMVGDRWKVLPADQRSQYETQAAQLKDQYNADFAAYKKTDKYREYQEYVAQFRLRYPKEPTAKTSAAEPLSSQEEALRKRPKLENQASTGSNESIMSTTSGVSQELSVPMGRLRAEPSGMTPISSSLSPSVPPSLSPLHHGPALQGSQRPYSPPAPSHEPSGRSSLHRPPSQPTPVPPLRGEVNPPVMPPLDISAAKMQPMHSSGTPKSVISSVSSGSVPSVFSTGPTSASSTDTQQRAMRSLPLPTPPSAGTSYFEPVRPWPGALPSPHGQWPPSARPIHGGPIEASRHGRMPSESEGDGAQRYEPQGSGVDLAGRVSSSSSSAAHPMLPTPQSAGPASSGSPSKEQIPLTQQQRLPAAPAAGRSTSAAQPFSLLLEAGESLARSESAPQSDEKPNK